MHDIIPAPTAPFDPLPSARRVSLSADFLYELGEVLERHGHVPASGAAVPGAVGYGLVELSRFVRAVVDAPDGDAR